MDSDYDVKTRVTGLEQLKIGQSGQGCLVVIHAPMQADLGRLHTLAKEVTTIGRGRDNDIVLPSDCVSRRHSRLELREQRLFVVDLASTNGTYVNDEAQPVRERPLERGDRLRIGDTIFKYLSGSDIEVQYHEILFRMTVTDGLTNLCNRKQLDATLREEIPRARRHDRDLSVLMLDIDHFKHINDTYGHLAGDSVLRGLAAMLQKRLRPNDRLGRYGGEEFCAILPETALANAAKIGEELRALVEAHAFVAEDKRINVTVSIGAGCLERRDGHRRPVPARGRDAVSGEAHGSEQSVSLRQFWCGAALLLASLAAAAAEQGATDAHAQSIADYPTGDSCLFCHRNEIGSTWLVNSHAWTVRPVGEPPEVSPVPRGRHARDRQGAFPAAQAERLRQVLTAHARRHVVADERLRETVCRLSYDCGESADRRVLQHRARLLLVPRQRAGGSRDEKGHGLVVAHAGERRQGSHFDLRLMPLARRALEDQRPAVSVRLRRGRRSVQGFRRSTWKRDSKAQIDSSDSHVYLKARAVLQGGSDKSCVDCHRIHGPPEPQRRDRKSFSEVCHY